MFTSVKCICSACGCIQSGMRPGQRHRKCSERTNKTKPFSPSEGGKNRTGMPLVTGRGIWEDLKEVEKRAEAGQ
jgi:hypothetical protein